MTEPKRTKKISLWLDSGLKKRYIAVCSVTPRIGCIYKSYLLDWHKVFRLCQLCFLKAKDKQAIFFSVCKRNKEKFIHKNFWGDSGPVNQSSFYWIEMSSMIFSGFRKWNAFCSFCCVWKLTTATLILFILTVPHIRSTLKWSKFQKLQKVWVSACVFKSGFLYQTIKCHKMRHRLHL